LKDISLRALEILRDVDFITCEDTRVTLKLLNRYEIHKPLISFHSKSNDRVIGKILKDLSGGKSCAYVSDSGTPTVSDPGSKLVARLLDKGGRVIPIPGPSAVHTALMVSGISFSDYIFFGFLSNKASRRRRRLAELKDVRSVLVFYESPYRVVGFLEDVRETLGNVCGFVAKEMTKKFENYYRGRVEELLEFLLRDGVRGEYTVILDNRNP
jgi:16S rRNA (cytidine1402-2'-O)-methyltransferase